MITDERLDVGLQCEKSAGAEGIMEINKPLDQVGKPIDGGFHVRLLTTDGELKKLMQSQLLKAVSDFYICEIR